MRRIMVTLYHGVCVCTPCFVPSSKDVEEGGARVACGARVDGSLLYVIAHA